MQPSGLISYKGVALFEYSFAIHGGAVGAIAVSGDAIPIGAVITGGLVDVPVAVLGGAGATLAISAVGAGDIVVAAAIAGFGLNTLMAVVPVPQTANTWIRLAATLTAITFTPAVNPLTAGRVRVALEYIQIR